MSVELVAIVLIVSLFLVLVVRSQPAMTGTAGGKLLLFAALFVLPIASLRTGLNAHLAGSKSTEFCMSCHVMEPYGQSLLLGDDRHIPANHFQNRQVDRDTACFTCHTQYARFGGLRAKMNGLMHLYVYYTGQTPDQIELYSPYNNRECLHCHIGSRRFEELHAHDRTELVANQISCMTCHGRAHDVHQLDAAPMWMDSLDRALLGGPIE